MIVKSAEDRAALIEGGKRLGELLDALREKVAPGIAVESLDAFAEAFIRERGDTPAFLNYTPEGAGRPYPATLCVSVNDEVVHGIPTESKRVLKQGDIVSLDLGLVHDGIAVDAAISVPVGQVDADNLRLIRATEEALAAGIAAAVPGGRIGDISHAIGESLESAKVTVVKNLGGHAIGHVVHEEPFIANYGHAGTGEEVREGMMLALEPIASLGKGSIILAPDGYTYRTRDGSRAAHTEHTILIEKGGALIVTPHK